MAEEGIGNTTDTVKESQAFGFDYTTPLVVDTTQQERIEGFVRPTGGIAHDGPYEFVLPSVSDSYLMMNKMSLYVQARVLTMDDTAPAATNIVAPCNNLAHSLWENIEVSINDYILSTSSTNNTHYKAYLDTILSYDMTHAESLLENQQFFKDHPDHYEDFNSEDNKVHRARHSIWKNGQTVDFMSTLCADFLRSPQHLAPGNKLTIKLTKANDRFLLNTENTTEPCKLKIVEMMLFYERIRLNDRIAHPTSERYLTVRSELKRFPLPTNMQNYNMKIHYGGKMPKMVVIGQVRTDAVDGVYHRNPFYFNHFGLNYLCLKVNGRSVPSDALKPDFRAKPPLVAREYNHLFKNTGKMNISSGNCVSLKDFRSGMSVFPFDFSPDLCNGNHMHVSKEGEISLELAWATPLRTPITILVYLVYNEIYLHKRSEADFEVQVV